eukprot:jgi/Bigna1/49538/estExt_Genewise1.C_510004
MWIQEVDPKCCRRKANDYFMQSRGAAIAGSLNSRNFGPILELIFAYDDSWLYEAKKALEGAFGALYQGGKVIFLEAEAQATHEWVEAEKLRWVKEIHCNSTLPINFGREKLYHLPHGFGLMKNLRKLTLRRNELMSFPEDISELSDSLECLDISENLFTSIPPIVSRLKSLQTLKIAHNNLKTLAGIEKLQSLRRLYANFNALKSIPRGITALSALKELWLNDNLLTVIPAEFGKLKEMQILHLDGNRISNLPSGLRRLSNLKRLTLDIDLHFRDPVRHLRSLGTFVTSACPMSHR